jgi:hypothetical protein
MPNICSHTFSRQVDCFGRGRSLDQAVVMLFSPFCSVAPHPQLISVPAANLGTGRTSSVSRLSPPRSRQSIARWRADLFSRITWEHLDAEAAKGLHLSAARLPLETAKKQPATRVEASLGLRTHHLTTSPPFKLTRLSVIETRQKECKEAYRRVE